MNVFDEADALYAWLLQNGRAPEALAHLRHFARRIVLEAAKVCEARAKPEDKSMVTRSEANKCAAAVRHFLLCKEGESVCLHCDGKGCRMCKSTGIKTTLM